MIAAFHVGEAGALGHHHCNLFHLCLPYCDEAKHVCCIRSMEAKRPGREEANYPTFLIKEKSPPEKRSQIACW